MTMGNIARKPPKRQWKFKKNIAASVPCPRVWWLGPKRSAALDDGATGGVNAGILRAHIIAAARVRRQSLQIHDISPPTRLPGFRFHPQEFLLTQKNAVSDLRKSLTGKPPRKRWSEGQNRDGAVSRPGGQSGYRPLCLTTLTGERLRFENQF